MKTPSSKSVLCFDLGVKRVGIAGCDPLGITVTPLKPLLRSSFLNEIKYINSLCNSRSVCGLIFGLPLDKHGNNTKQSVYSKIYGTKISKSLELPLAWVNEQCSTWQATQRFNIKDDRTGILDSATAVILLEQWLLEGPKLNYPE